MKALNARRFCGGLILGWLIMTAAPQSANANVNYYTSFEKGYITETYRTPYGIVAVNNRGNDINLIKDGVMTALVSSPGAGRYIEVSADGRYVGFKSINASADQAPAILDLSTGKVSLLAPYAPQCGQVSFAKDGTVSYTIGNTLYVSHNGDVRQYDLGDYVNIARLSPDATQIAYACEGECRVMDLATADTEVVYNLGVYAATWSPDGTRLAIRRTNGNLACYDMTEGSSYELGEVNSAAWSSDSRHLVVSRSQRVNELEVSGATVEKTDYRGLETATLVSETADMPVNVSVDGNEMLVSYVSGVRRGLESRMMPRDGVFGAPGKVSTVLSVPDDVKIGATVTAGPWGAIHDAAAAAAVRKAAPVAKAESTNNSIPLDAIPYINQVWDTPYCNGSVAYGYVCCAPTSSCMLLGYYGLLPDNPAYYTRSRAEHPAEKMNRFSFYISQRYKSPQTNYDFNMSANGNGTQGVRGGYGFMWSVGSPYSRLADFHMYNGVKASKNEYQEDNPRYVLRKECRANRPYVVCLKNSTGGHVVLAFRYDQIANADGSEIKEAKGSFICHDPYGNYNNGYPNYDGRHASYDLPGYNNGVANIQVFYWGTSTQVEDSGVDDITVGDAQLPVISAADGYITVSGPDTDKLTVEVYTTSGVMVYSGCAAEPVSGLAPGMYVVRAGNATAKVLL